MQYVADLEADLVLGHHPHVLQPVDRIKGRNGNELVVCYSSGNFFSGQHDLYTRIGGIFSIDLVKDQASASISLERPRMKLTHVEDHE